MGLLGPPARGSRTVPSSAVKVTTYFAALGNKVAQFTHLLDATVL